MSRIDHATIADAILTAPGWARVGITAPSPWLREAAAQELARAIADKASPIDPTAVQAQACLPL